ncbi:MAG: hypothetical protein PQ975_12375 [Methanobacterium sp.]|jgi:hypothetical protein
MKIKEKIARKIVEYARVCGIFKGTTCRRRRISKELPPEICY